MDNLGHSSERDVSILFFYIVWTLISWNVLLSDAYVCWTLGQEMDFIFMFCSTRWAQNSRFSAAVFL